MCHRGGRVVYDRRACVDMVIYSVYTCGRSTYDIYMRLFTSGLFTVQSGMLRLSAVAVSSDVVPGHWISVGLSNIKVRGSQSQVSMIGSIRPAHWVGMVFCMLSA